MSGTRTPRCIAELGAEVAPAGSWFYARGRGGPPILSMSARAVLLACVTGTFVTAAALALLDLLRPQLLAAALPSAAAHASATPATAAAASLPIRSGDGGGGSGAAVAGHRSGHALSASSLLQSHHSAPEALTVSVAAQAAAADDERDEKRGARRLWGVLEDVLMLSWILKARIQRLCGSSAVASCVSALTARFASVVGCEARC